MEKHNSYVATNDKVEMVHVSLERGANGADKALNWANKEGFPWLTVMPGKMGETIFKDIKVQFVPTYVLVDKDDKELLRGEKEVFEKIKSLK